MAKLGFESQQPIPRFTFSEVGPLYIQVHQWAGLYSVTQSEPLSLFFFFFLPCSICCQAYSVKGFQIRVLRWSLSDSLVSTLTSSRNSSWEVLVAIAKKNSFPPSSTGWFPNLSYGFGSVNSVNLRAKTQFRVTNEGYSVAAGAKLCCSYPSGFSASREATGIYTSLPQISGKLPIQKSAVLFKVEVEILM